MQYEIYCDESSPDLLSTSNPRWPHMLIGGLWIQGSLRSELKERIAVLRQQHGVWGELKWSKISPSSANFYVDLVNLFFDSGHEVRFRSIVIDARSVDMRHHGFDSELGFYKFYYQLLFHWMLPNQEYRVFTDLKTNRDRDRLKKLGEILGNARSTSRIAPIQALPSSEVVLLQLCDVLLGAVHFRFNTPNSESAAKRAVVEAVENRIGHKIASTWHSEPKFNVFKIQLSAGA